MLSLLGDYGVYGSSESDGSLFKVKQPGQEHIFPTLDCMSNDALGSNSKHPPFTIGGPRKLENETSSIRALQT